MADTPPLAPPPTDEAQPAATVRPSRKRPRVSPPPAGRAAPPPPAPAPLPSPSAAPTSSTPSAPLIPNSPLATLPLHPPSHYSSSPPIAFQQPCHLTSFSYSPSRELLLTPETRDEALAVYREPRLGSDLNRGFGEAKWRDGTVDEGLDGLLDTLSDFALSDPAASDLLSKISLITWRGMLTKLMLTVYECENVSQGKRGDGWEMNAMVVDGCLYLEESNPPSKLAKKAANESSYLLQSYYGYSFESYCTQSRSTSSHPSQPPQFDNFDPPNTNVQWCSVVKTNLGGFRTIVGGEVDCVRPPRPGFDPSRERVLTRDFVELKTNMVIQNQREEVNFERQKLLKHYIQSFLLGVPTITVGFRTRQGILSGLQHFNTLEIPRLVRGKPHSWDPSACLSSAHSLLSFIHRTISSHPASIAAEAAFSSSSPSQDDSEPLPSYPVFRVSFAPSSSALGPAGVSIRELTPAEVEVEVLGAKRKVEGEGGGRVGFLLERWVRGVRERRRAILSKAAGGGSGSSTVPSTFAPSHSPTAATTVPSGGRRVPPPPPPPAPPAATANGAGAGNGSGSGASSVLAGLKR